MSTIGNSGAGGSSFSHFAAKGGSMSMGMGGVVGGGNSFMDMQMQENLFMENMRIKKEN